MTKLTTAQPTGPWGSLLGTAAGDALGAGFEFGPPLAGDVEVAMTGGGAFGWAPGEWTDDTSMAIVIARVAADGLDLRTDAAQDADRRRLGRVGRHRPGRRYPDPRGARRPRPRPGRVDAAERARGRRRADTSGRAAPPATAP